MGRCLCKNAQSRLLQGHVYWCLLHIYIPVDTGKSLVHMRRCLCDCGVVQYLNMKWDNQISIEPSINILTRMGNCYTL